MQIRLINREQSPTTENAFNKTMPATIGFVFGIALLGLLTGCVGYVEGPQATVHARPAPVYVESRVVVQNDYVYYPSYQVYYSGRTRQYVYLDGSAWVTRPAPPRVSVDVLFASPSVTVDFHDAPAAHHAAIVRAYPRNWTPPGHAKKNGHDESEKEEHGQGKKNGHKKN